MVKSKFPFFSSWGLMCLVSIFFFVLFLSSFSQVYLGKSILIKMNTESNQSFNIYLSVLGCLLFGIVFVSNANIISIDTNARVLSFDNFITKKLKRYSFDNLDGYIDCTQRDGASNEYNVIYLVKEQKYVAKITSFSCSNFNEMKNGLTSLNYLGNRRFTLLDSLKVMLGLSVYHT